MGASRITPSGLVRQKIAILPTMTIDYAPLNAFRQIPLRILLKLHVKGAEISVLRYLPTWAAVP